MSNNISNNLARDIVNDAAKRVNIDSNRLWAPSEESKKIQRIVSQYPEEIKMMAQNHNDIYSDENADFEADSLLLKLKSKEINCLDKNECRILELPHLDEWIWKGKKEKMTSSEIRAPIIPVETFVEKNNGWVKEIKSEKALSEKHNNLLRPFNSVIMKDIIKEQELDKLDIVEDFFVVNPNAASNASLEENLLVFSKKANLLSSEQTRYVFLLLPKEQQAKIVTQICTFIKKTGLVDAHLGNFQFALKEGEDVANFPKLLEEITEEHLQKLGKLVVVDNELHGSGREAEDRVKLGIRNFRNQMEGVFVNGFTYLKIQIRIRKQNLEETDVNSDLYKTRLERVQKLEGRMQKLSEQYGDLDIVSFTAGKSMEFLPEHLKNQFDGAIDRLQFSELDGFQVATPAYIKSVQDRLDLGCLASGFEDLGESAINPQEVSFLSAKEVEEGQRFFLTQLLIGFLNLLGSLFANSMVDEDTAKASFLLPTLI